MLLMFRRTLLKITSFAISFTFAITPLIVSYKLITFSHDNIEKKIVIHDQNVSAWLTIFTNLNRQYKMELLQQRFHHMEMECN